MKRIKIHDNKNKIVILREEHLYSTYISRLQQNKMQAHEILFKHIKSEIKNYYEYHIDVLKCKVVINYKNKNYLLIYNK